MSLAVPSDLVGNTTGSPPTPLVVGVAGGSGSGKSTVTNGVRSELHGRVTVESIDMDAYYHHLAHLTPEARKLVNWDHPDALDLELLADHLGTLKLGGAVDKPVYDYVNHLRLEQTVHVEPAEVIFVDGILLFASERVRSLCDIRVYVDTDADLRLIRRIRRDMTVRGRPLEEILDQYLATVRPMHLEFVEPGREHAHLVVPGSDHSDLAVSLVLNEVMRHLELHEA